MNKFLKKLLVLSLVFCLSFFIINNTSLANNDSEIQSESRNYSEIDEKILIQNLINLNPEEQDSLKANSIRSKLTGLTIQEVEDSRSGKVPFYLNNALTRDIVFNEENVTQLKKEFVPEKTLDYPIYYENNDLTDNFSLQDNSIIPISEGRYNHAISSNNPRQNCYGYALGTERFVNPGYFKYNSNSKIYATTITLVPISKIKDYVIEDLKHLGKNPVLVS